MQSDHRHYAMLSVPVVMAQTDCDAFPKITGILVAVTGT